jgi:hypothetical protein
MAQRLGTRAQGERRRSLGSAVGSPHLADLSLAELRRYRAGLRAEEDRVSYWRRLVHARLDILEAGSRSDGVLTVEQLARVLGDTGSGRARGALMTVRSEEPLPDLPVLSTMWVKEVDPHDEVEAAMAVRLLREAETTLTEYRRALHARIEEATGELIVRYSADPSSALQVLGA